MNGKKFTFFLLLFLSAQLVWAQSIVKGVVKSAEDGEGLIGASVKIKGTTRGVVTDAEGKFELRDVPANASIEVSYTGFTTATIKVGNRTTIEVLLQADAATLDEVVVTTFGSAKKSSFTGSFNKIDAKDIANRPISNVVSAIAGTTAGVTTNAGSGQPGAVPAIRIRGFGSISSSNDPLYVVDGVPYTASIANLNPDDIESMTILKDAASTALYGARAANGVVMITTKKGTEGKGTVNVRMTKGFNSRALPEYDLVGAAEYYPLMWEAFRNSQAYRAANPVAMATANQNASNQIVSLLGYNVFNVPNNQLVGTDGLLNPNAQLIFDPKELDWWAPAVRQGERDEVNLNFNGGTKSSDYFFSFSYLNDRGFLIRSDFERYSARLNYNSQIKSWLRTGANINATISNSNQADAGGSSSFVNPFFFSRNMGPIYPVYALDPNNPGQFLLDANGERFFDYGNMNALGLPNRPQFGGRHAIAETILNQNFFRRNVIGARGYVEATFLKDFKFTFNVGTDITNRNDVVFGNPLIGDGAPAGRATHEFSNFTGFNMNQLLSYNKTFGNHNISALVGHENFQENDNFLTGSRSQQILDGNVELVNFTTTTNLNSAYNIRRVEGYFSRFNYDFKDKYFASFSVRRDGSSKFFRDVRWGTFYSASAAWRLDQEEFIKAIPAINMLKLRGSYGQTGNDGGISYYAWQPLYALGWNNATEAGILQSSLGNRQLEWESSNAFDVALEFSAFKNRIGGTIELFDRRSSNLIFAVPLPISAGILSETRNIGTMYNRGIEVELNLVPVRSKDFTWSIDLNATKLKNKITKMPEETPQIISGRVRREVGRSIYDYWLREFVGVRPETGEATYRAIAFNPANSFITESGDTLTTNFNNARFHYNGSSIPALQGGFTNTFTYKGLSLSTLVVYQIGGKVYDAAYAGLMGSGGYGSAKHIDRLQRWQNPGDITNVPRMDIGRTADFDGASDRWLTDASFFNVRSVTLSYKVPSSLTKRISVENLQVYTSAENYIILTKRKGMNVQQSFNGEIDNAFSPARNLVFGLSFSL